MRVKIQKNILCARMVIFGILQHVAAIKGKYAATIGDSVVMCDEIIDTTKDTSTKTILTKTVPTKYNLTNFYILLSFLLTTIALMIAVSVYHIKCQSKQRHLLPYHDNSKLKEIGITNIL